MSSKLPKIISLTTLCTAGCTHCPYSNPQLKKLFLSPSSFKKIISKTSENLIMLTGGEPFLHPEISNILKEFVKTSLSFRIATGGFIDLSPWFSQLKSLYRQQILQGMSIGTDVISQRVTDSKWVPVWKSNIQLLQDNKIPFSLTMTINSKLEFKWFDIWNWNKHYHIKPDFIYLIYENEPSKIIWIQEIMKTFKNIPIIEDNINL